MAAKGSMAEEPDKRGIKSRANNYYRPCCCPLKIKFGEFKHFQAKPFEAL